MAANWSAAMVLNVQDKQVLDMWKERFHLPMPSQHWETIKNAKVFLISLNKCSRTRVYSLLPSDAILRWRSWSTLVQVMADGSKLLSEPIFTAVKNVLWHSPDNKFTSAQELTSNIFSVINTLKLLMHLLGTNELILLLMTWPLCAQVTHPVLLFRPPCVQYASFGKFRNSSKCSYLPPGLCSMKRNMVIFVYMFF